jgi:hypothetical protein
MWNFLLGVLASILATVLWALAVFFWKKETLSIGPFVIARRSSLSQARFYKDNQTAADEVITDYIKHHTISSAVFVQYSCHNVKQILQTLWKKDGAHIRVYMANPDSEYVVNKWQITWIKRFLSTYTNDLVLAHRGHQTQIQFYQYDAPGAPRVIVLNDELIAFGCYFYEWQEALPERFGAGLDLRGGEMPLLIIRAGDPTFPVIHKRINDMLLNWARQEKVSKFHKTHPEASQAAAAP